MEHGDVDKGFTDLGPSLIIGAPPAVGAQPGEGALHPPADGQHLEAHHVRRALDHLQRPAEGRLYPPPQRAGIRAIGHHHRQPGQPVGNLGPQIPGAIAVLDVGGVDDHRQQPSPRLDEDVPRAPFHLLAGIVATGGPPVSVVFTA